MVTMQFEKIVNTPIEEKGRKEIIAQDEKSTILTKLEMTAQSSDFLYCVDVLTSSISSRRNVLWAVSYIRKEYPGLRVQQLPLFKQAQLLRVFWPIALDKF